jgi:hypothetical protein
VTFAQKNAVAARLARRQADLRRLEEMQTAVARYRRMVSAFESLPATHPVPVSEFVRAELPGVTAEIREQPSQPVVAGWVLRRVEIAVPEVSLDAFATFVARAEAQRPPWRLAECSIRASPRTGGYGQVTLVLEGLARTQ